MSQFNEHFERAKKGSVFWTETCKIEITEGILKLIDPDSINHKDMTELVENSIEDMLKELKKRRFYSGDLDCEEED